MHKMQSVSVFLDIGKFADFGWKNTHVSKNQGAGHDIHILITPSLGSVWLCQVSSL